MLEVPAEESILQVLEAHGCDLPSSCRSGTCGTCMVGLVAGEAEHRDFVLEEDERDAFIMICVSRAVGDLLVLDL